MTRTRSTLAWAVWLIVPLLGSAGARSPANAETLEVTGYAGVLGEWEVTARVSAGAGGATEYAGPVKMRHVGYCTQDGPEERIGQIRLSLSGSSRLTATLLVNGVECTYSGRQSDNYVGSLKCPDRRAVPFTLWLKPVDGE